MTEADAGAAWLKAAGEPGRTEFRAAGLAVIAATAATVLQWAAVAYLIDLVLAGGKPAAQLIGTASAAALAGAGRAAALAVSRRRSEGGHVAVAAALRGRLLPAMLPGSRGRPADGAQAGHVLIELTGKIAAYHQRTQPAARAAGPASAGVLAVIAVLHWPAAVLLALATPLLPVNLRLAGLATQEASRRQLAEFRRLSQRLLDRFAGMRTLVTLGAVEREREVVRQACESLNRATSAVLRRAFIVSLVLDAVITCSIAVCATYVGLDLLGYLHIDGTPHLGVLAGVLVLLLCPVYFAPLREHAAGYHERDEALAAAAILMPLDGVEAAGPITPVSPPWPRSAPKVEIDAVTVRYQGRLVLDGISAVLRAGSFAVLAAPSGAGKTTLLRVLAGLSVPSSGTVRLIGPDCSLGWLPYPGYASWIGQQTVLLPGSLAANIRLGSPGAGPAEVERAALTAGLGDVIARLPAGLETEVGERGWGISAGEARRVALARAVLRDAPLWLLDEPTAHLDAATELELIAAIRSAGAGRTVLIASHSTAMIDAAGIVWRLDRGVLLEPALAGAA